MCLSLAIVALSAAQAQDTTWQQELGGWLDGTYRATLFLGGITHARISFADIDGDGDKDLFCGGSNGRAATFYENVGDQHLHRFDFREEVWSPLPRGEIRGNLCLEFADLDNDADLDLFYNGHQDAGSIVFWNGGNSEEFWIIPDSAEYIGGMGSPILVDIDDDGDYDYFSGYGDWGTELIYYRNDGTPEVPEFVLISERYQDLDLGGLYHCDMSDIDFDGDYDLLVGKSYGILNLYLNDHIGPDPYFVLADTNFLSERSVISYRDAPRFVDIDADGDEDLFLSGYYGELSYFENRGLDVDPQFLQQYDTTYFVNFEFGSAMNNSVDLDGDGDTDMVPGTTLLRNEGPLGNPYWTKEDDFFPFVKANFCDIDGDGDYDMIIPGGHFTIGWFENIGDQNNAVWGEFAELFPPDGHLENVFSVTTADIDNDGDYDMFIGHNGALGIDFYRNIGSSDIYEFVYETPFYAGFHRAMGFDAVFGDIDDDGDLDLIVADVQMPILRNKLHLYINTGTANEAQWEHASDDFQGIFSNHRFGYGYPSLIDYDQDGDLDLVFGASLGLQLYLNPLIATDVEEVHHDNMGSLPIISGLGCYPNPFNSTAIITLEIGEPSDIDLSVYNLLGQRVASLVGDRMTEGTHRIKWQPENLAAGVYFLRASAGQNSKSIKILYLK
jgi:hypothetical protein